MKQYNNIEQCLYCAGYLFFKPLSDETFFCCGKHEETVKDIDIQTGVSPAIKRHGLEGVPCGKFEPGESICDTSKEKPFLFHPIRIKGEEELLALM